MENSAGGPEGLRWFLLTDPAESLIRIPNQLVPELLNSESEITDFALCCFLNSHLWWLLPFCLLSFHMKFQILKTFLFTHLYPPSLLTLIPWLSSKPAPSHDYANAPLLCSEEALISLSCILFLTPLGSCSRKTLMLTYSLLCSN